MVFGMIVLGGLTRLTHSGLSMVEWRPLTGWLPPLSHAEWEAAFRAYQQYPEFNLMNPDMTLAGFQGIYWLEFLHRLWGRLIGVVFFVPFLYFVIRGRIRGRIAVGCAILFALGALQGLLGWYMVKSGLIDRPDVSPYRLTAHFVAALLLYAALIWMALELLLPPSASAQRASSSPPVGVALLVLLTLTSGGFVAGTDAGYHFNTFPLMDGQWLPADLFVLTPWYRNFFENVPLVQFTHRVLALATLVVVLLFRLALIRRPLAPDVRRSANALSVWVCVQVALGIATLLFHMPVPLASLHQASGVVLWTLAVVTVFTWHRERCGGLADAQAAAASLKRGVHAF
jgi:cytochrome c oxidase assembly protein subunit 15